MDDIDWDDPDEYDLLFCQICSSWVEYPCEDYLESTDCPNNDVESD